MFSHRILITELPEASLSFRFGGDPVATRKGLLMRLTKSTLESIDVRSNRFTVFDDDLRGFGLRVYPSGERSWIVEYRPAGCGRNAPKRRLKLGPVGSLTPEQARKAAAEVLAKVRLGGDPARERTEARQALTFRELADVYLEEHVVAKRKARTASQYRDLLQRLAVPKLGKMKAKDVSRSDLARLHLEYRGTPFQANRLLAVIGAMYNFAERRGLVPEGINPSKRIEKFREHKRERFLGAAELERIGAALREAETVGVEWDVEETGLHSKHLAKPERRRTVLTPHATAAIRLLLLTGARLREILELKWDHVDFDRGLLLLPDSKSGQKAVVLNPPALEVLDHLPRLGCFVIAGNDPDKPRADLNRPWRLISKCAGLEGVRIHDLRHTYASFGAASGLGLPIIGKLLGHREASTTQRYAHLDNDPLRRASGAIGATIAAAMDGPTDGNVLPMRKQGGR